MVKRYIIPIIVVTVFNLILAAIIFCWTSHRINSDLQNQEFRIHVTFRFDAPEKDAVALLQNNGIPIPDNFYRIKYASMVSNDDKLEEYLQQLKNLSIVGYADITTDVDLDFSEAGSPFIFIIFSRYLSSTELMDIMRPFPNLSLTGRYNETYDLLVPSDKEEYYYNILKDEAIVENVTIYP